MLACELTLPATRCRLPRRGYPLFTSRIGFRKILHEHASLGIPQLDTDGDSHAIGSIHRKSELDLYRLF
jgi:hypothetical protein